MFSALLAHHGLGDVLAVLKVAGWSIAVLAAYHILPLAANSYPKRAVSSQSVKSLVEQSGTLARLAQLRPKGA